MNTRDILTDNRHIPQSNSKVHSIPIGLVFGLGVGLVLGYLAAMNPTPDGQHNYLEIMIPGAVVGAILGYATQKYGRSPKGAEAQ